MRRIVHLGVLVGVALFLAACASDSSDAGDDAGSSTTSGSSSTDSSAGSTSTVAVATTGSTTTSTTEPTTTVESTTASTTSTTSTVSSTSVTSSTSTTAAPTTTEILVIDGGVHEFTSPSGNIACVMDQFSVSCWIGEKNWTIEQPPGHDCAESDWGNVVDLSHDGPSFPCYTDFGWNPSAPAMAYGVAVELGPFRCDSAETGVTCRNASGNGFTVARAAVNLF